MKQEEQIEALEKIYRAVDWYAFDWHEYDEGSRARGVLPLIEDMLAKLKGEK